MSIRRERPRQIRAGCVFRKHRLLESGNTLGAWVGIKSAQNDYYPVIVGGYNYLSEARAIKEKALATKIVKDAYLSQGVK